MNATKTTIMAAAWLSALCLGGCRHKQPERWAWLGFERPLTTPALAPDSAARFLCPMRGDSVAWMESDVFNPAAAVKGDSVVVLFRAEDNSATGIGCRTSRIGYAASANGVDFALRPWPVLFPAADAQAEREHPGGCEDPRVALAADGAYVMLYTQWNRRVPRLAVATSTDLVSWTKHGPAFARAYGGRFADTFSKSASVVTEVTVDGRQTIAKIGGRYWMYWGEKFVNVATSDNLVDWMPMLGDDGELLRVMEPREGRFDSDLTECGPPAVLTDRGILLMYNGKNAADARRDSSVAANAYCGGQALFDAREPQRLLARLDKPFFVPEADFEKSGQYPAGTVFIEGLVLFKGRWLLYYGCADSRVGVAICQP